MKKESLINTALFLNILIYCCCFGVAILEKLLNTPFSSVAYHTLSVIFFIGSPVTYLIALSIYWSKKERDIFQLVLLIILPVVYVFFIFLGWLAASLSGALM